MDQIIRLIILITLILLITHLYAIKHVIAMMDGLLHLGMALVQLFVETRSKRENNNAMMVTLII
jgi:hypothetical protein